MIQTRDKVQCLTLPKLKIRIICPYRALKKIFKLYPMSADSSLLQLPSQYGFHPLTDSHVRKFLKRINIALNVPSNYFTFHDLRRSGATLAYNAHVPIKTLRGMAHGLLTVCGVTYSQIMHQVKVWLML